MNHATAAIRHALVDTTLGWIGLAWRSGDTVVLRVSLPAADRASTEHALLRGLARVADGKPPERIVELSERIRRYAAGEPVDFADVAVDVGEVGPLRRAIYQALRRIAYGQTLTYGELAEQAGFPGQAREIGQAMGRNPAPLIIPCHRVLAAGNKLGGFSAPGGTTTKQRMLALEGVRFGPPPSAQASFAF